MLGGQIMRGGSASRTVTVNLQLLLFPDESTAAQRTVVTPTGKVEPDGGLHSKLTNPQGSVAEAVYVTLLLEQVPRSALTRMFDGQTTRGGSVSLTVTVKVQLLLLPEASFAVQVTDLIP